MFALGPPTGYPLKGLLVYPLKPFYCWHPSLGLGFFGLGLATLFGGILAKGARDDPKNYYKPYQT
ncbi:MAG: hypothetical protein A2508_07440 [Candidatus Lambdaproteobacteria bacterium RIFOXYD12_FULL_49_8]|nr:MAG: hypothetical protein A2508_07440 [Candidatus Lambdaproteobacteria bacterium RIFOXYD12_FULL_49_8]